MSGPGVVVTGLGVVAGPDIGGDALAARLQTGDAATFEVDREQLYHQEGGARRAVLVANADLSKWVPPAVARRMSRPSRFAVAAARMAAADAGIDGGVGGPRTGVVMSTAFGAVESTEQILETVRLDGPLAASPFVFAESVANAAAGQIAIDAKAQGPNVTIVQREAGSVTAVGRGAALVTSGRCDRVIVGAVDEMPPVLHALLDRFGALARPGDTGGEIARPFDRARAGFVAAEGAVVLILEREDAAHARGARVRARLRAFASAFDVTAPRIGWGHGHTALGAAAARMLDRAGLTPPDIAVVISGASGAVAGDRLEALTLRETWGGSALPPVLAPKAWVGQYGGGHLAAAILAVGGAAFASTPGFSDVDPALGVRPHDGTRLPAVSPALVTALASGGAAAWLVLEGP